MSYKSKKIISFICCIIVLISITLVGCTNNASKTIVIWAWDSMAESATKAVAIYKENHPEIEYDFEVVTLGQDDMVEKVKIALSTNSKSTLPDIFYDEDYNFAEYLTYYGDYFYDITSLLDLSDYYSYKTANVVYDNKTYAIPYDSGTGVMFYRTDLIHDAGYKDSDMENLTWEQFIEIGKVVKSSTGVDMIVMCPEGDMEGRMLYQSAGTWFFDDNGNSNIQNNKAFEDAFKTIKSVYDAKIVYDAVGWDDYISAIANKKIVTLVGASWWAPIISAYTEQSNMWKITTMPRMSGNDAYSNYSNLGGGNWFIINNNHSQEAAKFAVEMFGSNIELANYMANTYFVLPTNKKVISKLTTCESEFWCGQDIAGTICSYNDYIKPIKYGLNTYEITYTVGPIVGQYIDGKISLENAIRQMQAAADNISK